MDCTVHPESMSLKRLCLLFCVCVLAGTARSQSYQELIETGLKQLEQQQLLEAELTFREAIKVSPVAKGNALLYRHIGQIQEQTNREREALESYTTGLNLAPDNVSILLCRASLYLLLDNRERALDDYSQILKLNPDHVDALFYRAYIYSVKRDYKRARIDYEQLLTVDVRHEKGLIGLAILNDKSGRPREAIEQINNVIQFFPNHATGYSVRGDMELRRKQYELAMFDFERAIELEPSNPDYYINRGCLYLALKKKKQARADFQQALFLGAPREQLVDYLLKAK